MSKPDDRRDNVDKLQETIDNTIENMRLTEEAIEETANAKTKAELEDKNKRRQEALESLRSEIRDEAIAKKNGYK
ncbi:small acid-soluble spore protein Tlp [Clostridium thermarum]|uniref:small acid-soluble spore protein Tlp n=1 Tax=Clostridium thermarum TaxID=1716543 RepID=UPI0011238B94|nr:small acid-soluble spore protein Tlp [Clostridium thermarum]